MKKTQFIDAVMTIRKRLVSWLSIVTIIAIGIAAILGVFFTGYAMDEFMMKYYIRSNYQNFQVFSTVGVTEDDVEAVKKIKGVTGAEGAIHVPGKAANSEDPIIVQIYSITKEVNKSTYSEGKEPVKNNECAVTVAMINEYGYSVGDKIRLSTSSVKYGGKEINNLLKEKEFTITGVVNNPLVILGDLKVVFVQKDAFDLDAMEGYMSNMAITVDCMNDVTALGDLYTFISEGYSDEIESELEKLSEKNTKELNEKADEKIADAEKDLADAEKKLTKNQNKLEEKQAEYNEKKAEFEKKKKQLAKKKKDIKQKQTDAINEINDKEAKLNQEIAEAKQNMADSREVLKESKKNYKKKIEKQEKKYEKELTKLNKKKSEYESAVKDTENKIDSDVLPQLGAMGADTTDIQNASGIKKISKTIDALDAILNNPSPYIPAEQLQALKVQRDELKNLSDQFEKIDKAVKKGETALEKGRKKLDKAKADTEKELEEAEKAIDELEKTIDDKEAEARTEIGNARAELADKIKEADEKIKKAENKRKKAEKKFAKAEKKLDDATDKLSDAQDDLEDAKQELADQKADVKKNLKCNLYLRDRESDLGYTSVKSPYDAVMSVSRVFSPLFAIVAILVCASTIMIIVEEHIRQIGTMKALGFTVKDVKRKYRFYGVSATTVGTILGCLGSAVLQYIFHRTLAGSYSFGQIPNDYDAIDGGLFCVFIILISFVVINISCNRLIKMPAVNLLNANKDRNIWKKKDNKKLAARAIKKNKKNNKKKGSIYHSLISKNLRDDWQRVTVSVVVILGCTLLIGTGFTLRTAFHAAQDLQLTDIDKYDVSISLDNEGIEKYDELVDILEKYNVEYLPQSVTTCIFDTAAGKEEGAGLVIYDEKDISKFLNLKDMDGNHITLDSQSILVPQKIFETSGAKKGEVVWFANADVEDAEVKIREGYDYYFGGYVLISREYYEKLYGESPAINAVDILLHGADEDALIADIKKLSDGISYSGNDSFKERYRAVSLLFDAVIVIIIMLSIMLMFMILLNLTNILVKHRIRDILIMRVNGFTYGQCIGYLLREVAVITVIGIFGGIVSGIYFSQIVVKTVEIGATKYVRTPFASAWVIAAILSYVFSLAINFIAIRKVKRAKLTDLSQDT